MCYACREKAKKSSQQVSCEGCENAPPEVLDNNQNAFWVFQRVLPVLFCQGRIDLENVNIMLDTLEIPRVTRGELINKILVIAVAMKTGAANGR